MGMEAVLANFFFAFTTLQIDACKMLTDEATKMKQKFSNSP